MSRILSPQAKKKRLQYSRDNVPLAYSAVIDRGMSVYKAARAYSVPESTLRDRVKGNIAVDARVGHATIFTLEEEKALVDHLLYMGKIGYGYTKADIQFIGKDYAIALGKKLKSEDASGQLSNNWFYGFLSRWEDIKLVKPQKLSIARAKGASPQNISKYFKELSTVLTNNNLHSKPSCLFNIDETGVTTAHEPSRILCGKDTKAQSITSDRSASVTLIAAGNAIGNFIPPYYVFPGKRWNPEFMTGAAPGASGEMSETGWSNMKVFHNYITTHFANHAGITNDKHQEPKLVLYDGHRSHISLTLADWAQKRNVILFVLPPHSSHLTQPLDVGIFGPFKNMYNRECATYMQKHPGIGITKYEIATLTCNPYLKSMSPQNLVSSFRKTGIHPFDNKAILPNETAPSVIYVVDQCTTTCTEPTEPSPINDAIKTSSNAHGDVNSIEQCSNVEVNHTSQTRPVAEKQKSIERSSISSFFEPRTIKQALVKKPKRKFVPPYLAGNLSKTSILNTLKNQKQPQCKTFKPEKLPQKNVSAQKKIVTSGKAKTAKSKEEKSTNERPSTSGLGNKGGPITLSEDSSIFDTESDQFTDDEETCCVCEKWHPDDLEKLAGVVFVKWGKCDFCSHWTHLSFCTPIKVLRRGSVFRCPHCVEN